MSDMHSIRKEDDRKLQLQKRDAETVSMLGGFVAFISLPVLIGTFWADKMSARVVNIGAGLVLLLIGLLMLAHGLRNVFKLR